MGQTTTIFPGLKKAYRTLVKNKFVDNLVHKTLDYGVSGFSTIRRFEFPKKFNWDWKLEMLLWKYEKETVNLFRQIIKPGMTIVDVGAHVGYFTRLYSSLVGPNGKVYAFEASPQNFAILKRNTKNLTNVTLYKLAVSDKTGWINFDETENNTGCHSLIPSKNRPGKTMIQSISLDEMLKNGQLQNIDLIKMDIEGAEPIAFEGMKNVIDNNPNIGLIIEFCPDNLLEGSISAKDFITRLHNSALRTYAITEDGLKEITPEANTKGNYFLKKHYVNIYCTKEPMEELTN